MSRCLNQVPKVDGERTDRDERGLFREWDLVREYRYSMIERVPSFLNVVWIGSSPTSFPLYRRKLSLMLSTPVCLRLSLLTTDERGGGWGAKSYDDEKAWSSINPSYSQDFMVKNWVDRARICKQLRSPGIDSEVSISPAYVAWRASTTNRVVPPARQAGNRFLGSLKGLQIRAQDKIC